MRVGNRGFCSSLFLSIGRLTLGLVFRFLWRYVEGRLDVYQWTGKNDYVNPSTSPLAAGAYIFYFIYLLCQTLELYIILNRDGRYGLYLDDTLLDGSSARCPHIRERTALFAGYEEGWEHHF